MILTELTELANKLGIKQIILDYSQPKNKEIADDIDKHFQKGIHIKSQDADCRPYFYGWKVERMINTNGVMVVFVDFLKYSESFQQQG